MTQFSFLGRENSDRDIKVRGNGREVPTYNVSKVLLGRRRMRKLYRYYFWVDCSTLDHVTFSFRGRALRVQTPGSSIRNGYHPNAKYNHVGITREYGKGVFQTDEHVSSESRYESCWLLMDHDQRSDDNAEHFYRYLLNQKQFTNAYFILSRESDDWDRLSSEGFKLIEYKSDEHRIAMSGARYLISSHADDSIIFPFGRGFGYNANKFSFVFLQHGVIQSDLSGWLNEKPIDVFLATTFQEHASIISRESNYKYSPMDVFLIGMPRHDRLVEMNETKSKLVIAPTWRKEFVTGKKMEGMKKRKQGDFLNSKYFKDWNDLLNSNKLRALASDRGLEIVFAPHPNMRLYLEEFQFPEHVSVFDEKAGIRYQEIISKTTAVVTDYSSVAFDFALSGSTVIYYQADKSEFFQPGHHVGSFGYFDYENDGFGPVVSAVDGVLDAIDDLAGQGSNNPFEARVVAAFPFRDGRNCERLFGLLDH
tara:strand:+ start:905 stop:2338 length:1434 start_codon:yes stop_codon:yes gene_type:complete